MKRICIISVTLILFFRSVAQVELGFFAGPHASSAAYKINGDKQPTDFKFGFHLGAGVRIPFENRLLFLPGISYKLMGYKVEFNRPSFPPDLLAKDNNTRFHEIDLDLLLEYQFSQKPNHFFLRAGPSFGFILAGREEYNLITGQHISRSMKFSVLNSYGRYGAAIAGQLGFEISGGFTIAAQYVENLISMNNEDESPSIRNRIVAISFGKFFKTK